MSDTYPHMCRMDHEEIGYRGDDERCPVCKRIDEIARQQAVVDWARENSFLTNSIIKGRVGDDAPIYVNGYGIICVHADRYAIIPREDYERLQAVLDAVQNVPWMLKHAAGAYIDLDRPDLHAKCMDKADEILRALSEVKP